MQICALSLVAMLQCLLILHFPKDDCSVTKLLEPLLSPRVLRESLSLGQLYKLKIPALLMTGSSAKSFNLISKCFNVTEVPFFVAKEEQQVYQFPCFLNSLNRSRDFTFLGDSLQSFDYLQVQMEQEQHFAKVFDLDCIWNLRFGAHANCVCFKISIPCIPCCFKWMLFLQLIGIKTTLYLKHKNSKPCKKPCSSFKLYYSDFVEKSVMESIQACYKSVNDWVCEG